MVAETMLKIVHRLLERSRKGDVAWQKTIIDNEYIVSFPSYSMVIGNTRFNYKLSLADAKGSRLESIEPSDLDDVDLRNEAFHALEQLFVYARRKALRIDRQLEDVLKALDQEGPVGLVDEPYEGLGF